MVTCDLQVLEGEELASPEAWRVKANIEAYIALAQFS